MEIPVCNIQSGNECALLLQAIPKVFEGFSFVHVVPMFSFAKNECNRRILGLSDNYSVMQEFLA